MQSENTAAVCSFLDGLGIKYNIFYHSPVQSIEECKKIEEVVGGEICKNLLLTNSAQSVFYLLMLKGDKRFVTSEVSKKLGSSRLSFASAEVMEKLLNTRPGSLSITSLIFDKDRKVSLAADREVFSAEYICCHPSDNTATLRIKTSDIVDIFLPALGVTAEIIDI